ncbi:TPA: hypothetical protein WMU43_002265, partial [Neisseria gonorrhoeae]
KNTDIIFRIRRLLEMQGQACRNTAQAIRSGKDYTYSKRHIDLAMSNTGVITAFNQCRSALFYRLRGKHRHPRTAKMLRYYFAAQDIHERISSAHVDYQEMSEKF